MTNHLGSGLREHIRGFQWGTILLPRTYLEDLETCLVSVTVTGACYWYLTGSRPGVLLNIPQWAEQAPPPKSSRPQMSAAMRV